MAKPSKDLQKSFENVEEVQSIIVKGAKEHNLKSVDVELPKKKFIVFTGLSGSGKSSLAFDTIYAEGQRRYVESLSSYARQFLGLMEKPKFDTIRGLSPAIAIEQKAASKNPRSTVGTITEIYDYLRVLYARLGVQYCCSCDSEVGSSSAASVVRKILTLKDNAKIMLLSPLVENRKGEHKEVLDKLKANGFLRVRVDGVLSDLEGVQKLAKNKKHNIEAVIDRMVVKGTAQFKKRLTDSVETALKVGQGHIIVHEVGGSETKLSEARSCCDIAYPKLDPPLFSFNSPLGMCTGCSGLGTKLLMDENRIIPDKSLSIREGAVLPWKSYFEGSTKDSSWGLRRVKAMEKQWKLNLDTPWQKLPKKMQKLVLFGSDDPQYALKIKWSGERSAGTYQTQEEGLLYRLMRRYEATTSDVMKAKYSKFLAQKACDLCHGNRLKEEVLAVRVGNKSIIELTQFSIEEAFEFVAALKFPKSQQVISKELLKEVQNRLGFLLNVGLGYLSLNRLGPTLSGGEAQRIRLASQIGSDLTGVLYILDEPSIGLHQRDNIRLLHSLLHLRNIGNTVIVIEHDKDTMEQADWLVDIGPGAGNLGGTIVASAPPAEVMKNKDSLTGQYLKGTLKIPIPKIRRTPQKTWLSISDIYENNLRLDKVSFPLGVFACVTGVSGAGKSTLINRILYPALANKLHGQGLEMGEFKKLTGYKNIDKIININQSPIGRTPRSNPATYSKVFDLIRDLFASLPESKIRGYQKGRFSFNVAGGRCDACSGDGQIKVEMHFLPDVYVKCEECLGKRFNEATLEVQFKGHSIAEVLDLTINQAIPLFENQTAIKRILDTLVSVGLGYIHLGQAATTLSGGEAQRIKLAKELARKDTGNTFYILDEPTTGLHFHDISNLLRVLHHLVELGNTVLVIEHNLDVIKTADWILDLGPEGGDQGGLIVAEGTPEQVSKVKASHTGHYLGELL